VISTCFCCRHGSFQVWVTPSRWSKSSWGLRVHHRLFNPFPYFYLCNLFCDWCVLKSMLRDHLWEQQQQWNSYRQKEIDNLQLSYMSIICFLSTHVNIFKLLNHVLYWTLRIGFVVDFIDSQVITCHELTIFTFCMQGLLFAPEFWWPIVTPHWGREFLTCFFLYVSSKFHEYLHLYM
jgi:hypothetical protein